MLICFINLMAQRHKLGSNLTPVTPETFAKWKKTRMDKKEAEQEAMRKAKEAHHSAGKNVGMSGRDLVSTRYSFIQFTRGVYMFRNCSSNTTRNGLKRKMRVTPPTTGTSTSIDERRRQRI